jgi:hypothetical protein
MIRQHFGDVTRRKRLMEQQVSMHPQANLLEVICALRLTSGFARHLDGRQHERHKHADDRHDHENFDKCEAAAHAVSSIIQNAEHRRRELNVVSNGP